jgi:NAD(P)-dependent dehydrogenase (short-subunit alcohol dehydrogenase family)
VILRPGVLDGVRVVAGGSVAARMAELGADVNGAGREADVLVWDGAAAFSSSAEGVRAVLDEAWDAIRAVLVDGLLIVLIAPSPGDAHAEAARAGLENMARTLSIEWARRGIRPVAITPGAATSPAEIAELVAFLASPAGAYYSGCRFDLGQVSPLSA